MENINSKKYVIGIVVVLLAVWIGFSFGKKAAAPEAPINGNTEEQATTTPTTTETTGTKTTATAPKTTTTSSAPAMTKSGSYIVYYTNQGFKPGILTIKAGKSVHFVNSSSKAMSLTTTDTNDQVHSEFNQGKTVGQGASYDFTFLTSGDWGYMNRNNPGDRGTIIVQ